jgi:hypothetical protein
MICFLLCKARIDVQGALHHIIARGGVERKRIFTDGVLGLIF